MLEADTVPFPVLPEELIREILLRLPVSSLLQFKCVCKSWKIVISSSQFVKSHLRISNSDPTINNQQLVFSPHKHPWEIVSYPLKHLFENQSIPIKPGTFDTEKDFYGIIGSCNGLLCLDDMRLCNPSLRLISKPSSVPVWEENWGIKHYGFGYDQVNDKYKLLVVVEVEDEDEDEEGEYHYHTLTKIHTFGHDDSWKTISNLPYNIRGIYGKFVSGTLNWIVSNRNTFVSFDVDKETYIELLLPQNDSDNNVNICSRLYVLRNCLCVCENVYWVENVHWVLWLMKEYGVVESWTKFIVISCNKLLQKRPCLLEPLFISQNGVLMVLIGSELILYNTNIGVALDPFITMELGYYSQIYYESLVSLPC